MPLIVTRSCPPFNGARMRGSDGPAGQGFLARSPENPLLTDASPDASLFTKQIRRAVPHAVNAAEGRNREH